MKKYRNILLYAALLLCVAGIILCYVFRVNTGDRELDELLNGILPRVFLGAGLGALIAFEYKKLLSFPKPDKAALVCIAPCLLVPLANFPFSALISGQASVTRPDLLWLFIIKCLLIGIVEEWLFRGMVLDFFESFFKKDKYRIFYTVLFSSAVFGGFHLINLFEGAAFSAVALQVGYSFLIGCMLSAVFLRTRNLWACVILHTLFDIGGLIVSDIGAGNPHDTIFWILTAVCGALTAAHIIYTILKMHKEKLG